MDQMTYPHIDDVDGKRIVNSAIPIYLVNREEDYKKYMAARRPIGTELIKYGYEAWNTTSEDNPNYKPEQHDWGKRCSLEPEAASGPIYT